MQRAMPAHLNQIWQSLIYVCKHASDIHQVSGSHFPSLLSQNTVSQENKSDFSRCEKQSDFSLQ